MPELAGAYALAASIALLLVAAAAVVAAGVERYSEGGRERAFERYLVAVGTQYRQSGERGGSGEERELDEEGAAGEVEAQRRAALGALLSVGRPADANRPS